MSENIPQRTQTIGFRAEVDFGEDPIVDGDEEFFEFGIMTQSWGKFPQLESEIFQSYKGTSYDPYNTTVSKTNVVANLLFIPVNGIMYYFLLARKESAGGAEDGGIVDDGGSPPEFTIAGIQDGELQSLVLRYKTSNVVSGGSTTIEKSITGCRLNMITVTLDVSAPRIPLGMSISVQGQRMVPIQVDTEDATIVFPDNIKTPYYFNKTNTLFVWDGTNLKEYLMGFSYTTNSFNRPTKIINKIYPNWLVTGNRAHGITFTLRATNETSVFEDYMDQAGSGEVSDDDFKTLVFKIFKDNGTDYLQYTFTTVGIRILDMPNIVPGKQEVPFYEITALVESVEIRDQSGIVTHEFMGLTTP